MSNKQLWKAFFHTIQIHLRWRNIWRLDRWLMFKGTYSQCCTYEILWTQMNEEEQKE